MKIEQLQQLLQIVAEGSMNEAAQKLYSHFGESPGGALHSAYGENFHEFHKD